MPRVATRGMHKTGSCYVLRLHYLKRTVEKNWPSKVEFCINIIISWKAPFPDIITSRVVHRMQTGAGIAPDAPQVAHVMRTGAGVWVAPDAHRANYFCESVGRENNS